MNTSNKTTPFKIVLHRSFAGEDGQPTVNMIAALDCRTEEACTQPMQVVLTQEARPPLILRNASCSPYPGAICAVLTVNFLPAHSMNAWDALAISNDCTVLVIDDFERIALCITPGQLMPDVERLDYADTYEAWIKCATDEIPY